MVRRLHKLFTLPRLRRGLLVRALALLWLIRVALWLLPFKTVRGLVDRAAAPGPGRGQATAVDIAWAIERAGRCLPGDGNCLVHAMAAQVLLARGGLPSHMKIGVARDRYGRLQAHAWVESEGRLLVGGAGSELFKPIYGLESERG